MKTTGSTRVPARRRFPLIPAVFALGVAVTAIGAGLAWDRSTSSVEPVREAQVAPAQASHDPQAVLRSHMADSLRYRTALTRAEVASAEVLGGRVVRGAGRDPVVARILRYFPALTPGEVTAMRFGKG
jgi:hypothetical protein